MDIDSVSKVMVTMELTDFRVNEAWLIFKVNDVPLKTEEGNANIYLIIDAASTFILGNLFSLESDNEISEISVIDVLNKCWSSKEEWPRIIYLEENNKICIGISKILKIMDIHFEYAKGMDMNPIIEEVCEAFVESFQ